MELVDMKTLDSFIYDERFPFILPVAMKCFVGTVAGVAHLTQHGLTHNDIKGSNILMSPLGIPKLVDFGMAVMSGEENKGGTPLYQKPDRDGIARNENDMYATGVVLAEIARRVVSPQVFFFLPLIGLLIPIPSFSISSVPVRVAKAQPFMHAERRRCGALAGGRWPQTEALRLLPKTAHQEP